MDELTEHLKRKAAAKLTEAERYFALIQGDVDRLIERHTYDEYDVLRIVEIAGELRSQCSEDVLAVTLAVTISRLARLS